MRRYMNIKLKTLIMGCLVASSLQVGAFAQEAVSYPGYRLAWVEEFEGAGLPDSNYWNTGDTGGVINNEWQDYRKENLNCTRLEDGKLILTAYKDPHKGVRGWGSKEDYHLSSHLERYILVAKRLLNMDVLMFLPKFRRVVAYGLLYGCFQTKVLMGDGPMEAR